MAILEGQFTYEYLAGLANNMPQPLHVGHNGQFFVWSGPMPVTEYIVAVDPGWKGDCMGLQVIEKESGKQCAEYLGEAMEITEQAHFSHQVARDYNGALLVVEANGYGAAVSDYLSVAVEYKNLYHDDCMHTGFLTTGTRKAAMVREMQCVLRGRPEVLKSQRLMEEIMHSSDEECHDDLLRAMMIAQGVRAGIR